MVGRNGEFDQPVSSTVRRVKRNYRDDNSALVLVLPYLTAEYENNHQSFHEYYDEIEICQDAAEGHYKAAIQVRNREMVLTLAMVLGMLPAMNMTASAAEMTYIKHVDIQMTAPRAGMTAEEYAATIGVDNKHELSYNNLVVDTLNCYRVDDSSFDHVGTDVPSFVEDGVYHCFVDIVMNDDTGYQFEHDDSEITVLVNGQTLDNYDYDRETGYVARFDNDGYTLTYAIYFTATSITGSGTEDDPYIVTDYDKLRNLMVTAPIDGSTRFIKLGADLLSNSNSNGNDLELVDARARVDLDLAGHSITRDETTSDWSVFFVHCGYLTVRDSVGTGRVVENIRGAKYRNVFNVTSDAHLTIEGGTFESKTGNVILGQGSTTVINGGTFTNEATKYDDAYRVINFYAGKLTINGGDFRGQWYGIEFNKGVEVTINACTVSLSGSSGRLISVNGGYLDSSRFGEYSKIVDAEGKELWYYHHLKGAYCRVIGPIPVTKVAIEGIVPPVAGEAPSNIVGGDTVLEHCSIVKYIGGEHAGENIVECLGCGAIIAHGTAIAPGEHTPASTWNSDGEYHWKTCTVAGCGVIIDGSKAAHTSTGANVATCQHKAVCDVCNVEYGEKAAHKAKYRNAETDSAKPYTTPSRATGFSEKASPEKTQAKKETDCDNLLTGCHTAHSLHCPYL